MKNSRKIKKVLVSILTATLSIIMLVTSTSAETVWSPTEEFYEDDAVYALESICWDPNRDWFIFAIDLTCFECDNFEFVDVSLEVRIYYPTSVTEEGQHRRIEGRFTAENTEDSDELIIHFQNVEHSNHPPIVTVKICYWTVYYENGEYTGEIFKYIYDIDLFYEYYFYSRRIDTES